MKLQGEVDIQASCEDVWDFLVDFERMKECIPGLQSYEVIEPGKKFLLTAGVGLGTVNVKFDADIEWTDLERPHHAAMRGHGTAPGSAGDATAEVVLSDNEDGTAHLDWSADVNVSGTIASLASRLMGGVSKRLTAAFFACVKEHVEG
jgi:carbon monoxide dehydrogenase subunit G